MAQNVLIETCCTSNPKRCHFFGLIIHLKSFFVFTFNLPDFFFFWYYYYVTNMTTILLCYYVMLFTMLLLYYYYITTILSHSYKFLYVI
ncbi:hypothetical protein C2G38_2054597 [Gigaspora rosea]|uniref:Uncharacterized protein n=1 Tax=Gigaspora rosea TaxID=44941 RepID=A0A397W7V7_9GLOM|nr:hypothetical protein C2G38_2054597 [Gigaspora rosea]